MKKIFTALFFFGFFIALTAPLITLAQTVTVTSNTTNVAVGGTLQLTAEAKNNNGNVIANQPANFGWNSSNANSATVNSSGLVTGVAPGTAIISALYQNIAGTISITVAAAQTVATVSITPHTASVVAGGTVQLTATAKDAAGNVMPNQTFTWITGNSAVATINGTGLVTGVSAGTAAISALASNNELDVINVTVTAAAVPPAAGGGTTGAGPIKECNLKQDLPGVVVEGTTDKCLKANNPINESDTKGWALCCIIDVINRVVDIVFQILLAFAILIMLAGAYYFLTAGGDPSKVQKGQNYILYGVIGLVVALLAKAIAALVKSLLA